MKIAIPSKNNMVDSHFGHCDYFTVFTAEEGKIIHVEELPAAADCGCKSGLAGNLRQMGVETLLAGGIGQGAINVLNSHGIEVYRGCSGNVRKLAEDYLKGVISDSGDTCNHHHHHHGHEGSCGHRDGANN
jgi:predicted Fe-Mo cluster-binding NifX family protein